MTPLRQRMLEDMRLRNLAPATQRNYIAHVAAFARFFGKSPEVLDQEAVREYLLYLLQERKLSPEGVNQQVSALKFLYLTTLEMPWSDLDFPHVRRPHRLPVVLSHEEVVQFFDYVPNRPSEAPNRRWNTSAAIRTGSPFPTSGSWRCAMARSLSSGRTTATKTRTNPAS